ncbi:MTH938/NDUFAF3 family protein [Fangia hongkongensis]|uniref:MTH938/NDUFAF3 family protein n=2 Tax=Fangia hongkongensis TaxID=270495 RepID=UPI000379BDED|nr:MTH938/NDUFAF3 family protein [Fangia hongkongensis]
MNLELEQPDSNIYIKHFENGKIAFPQHESSKNVIFDREKIIVPDWSVSKITCLNEENIKALIHPKYEIVLLGTGNSLIIPPKEILHAFAKIGKSLDFMNSNAACRTFNLLAHDEREVIAAIIV